MTTAVPPAIPLMKPTTIFCDAYPQLVERGAVTCFRPSLSPSNHSSTQSCLTLSKKVSSVGSEGNPSTTLHTRPGTNDCSSSKSPLDGTTFYAGSSRKNGVTYNNSTVSDITAICPTPNVSGSRSSYALCGTASTPSGWRVMMTAMAARPKQRPKQAFNKPIEPYVPSIC